MRRAAEFSSQNVINLAERLGERIRIARKSRGFSLADLERICRIHRTTLGRLERGDLGASIGVFFAVMEALGEIADVELLLSRPNLKSVKLDVILPILERNF